MRRRGVVLWLVLFFGLACGGLMLIRLLTPTHNITAEALKQLQEGMTQAEVESILGGPPGNYGRGEIIGVSAASSGPSSTVRFPSVWSLLPSSSGGDDPDHETKEWLGDDVGVYVSFSPRGRAFSIVSQTLQRRAESLGAKLRRLLRL